MHVNFTFETRICAWHIYIKTKSYFWGGQTDGQTDRADFEGVGGIPPMEERMGNSAFGYFFIE